MAESFFLFNCIEPQWGMNDTGWGELESKTSFHTMKKVNKTYSHMSDTGELTGLREQNTFKKKKNLLHNLLITKMVNVWFTDASPLEAWKV